MRVVLDSNVYISALQFGGRATNLLRMAVDGDLQISVSEPILVEVIGVLREKFAWEGHSLHAARLKITHIAKQVTPSKALEIVVHDPADNRVLECADEAGAEYIITEDRDLLRLKQHGNARVVRVSEFLELPGARKQDG